MKKQNPITKQDLPKLLQSHLPEYKEQIIKIKPTFGMTNQTYQVTAEGLDPVIFRILSPVIDRKYENKILELLNQKGICPPCIFTCETYRIQKFIENAQHPSTQKINQDDKLLRQILNKLYELHNIKLPGDLKKSFLSNIVFSDKNKQKCKNSKCNEKQKQEDFEYLRQKIIGQFDSLKQKIQHRFTKGKHTARLCHNDMNNNNIFIKKNGHHEILFIDFQYACLNYVAYDLANFLNECCFDYFDEAPGFKVYKRVNEEQIQRVCQHYPGKYEGLQQDVKQMLKLSNFWWAVWSLKIKSTKNVENFSPTQHGKCRWQLYLYYSNLFKK